MKIPNKIQDAYDTVSTTTKALAFATGLGITTLLNPVQADAQVTKASVEMFESNKGYDTVRVNTSAQITDNLSISNFMELFSGGSFGETSVKQKLVGGLSLRLQERHLNSIPDELNLGVQVSLPEIYGIKGNLTFVPYKITTDLDDIVNDGGTRSQSLEFFAKTSRLETFLGSIGASTFGEIKDQELGYTEVSVTTKNGNFEVGYNINFLNGEEQSRFMIKYSLNAQENSSENNTDELDGRVMLIDAEGNENDKVRLILNYSLPFDTKVATWLNFKEDGYSGVTIIDKELRENTGAELYINHESGAPDKAGLGVYRDFNLGNATLRLYAIGGQIDTEGNTHAPFLGHYVTASLPLGIDATFFREQELAGDGEDKGGELWIEKQVGPVKIGYVNNLDGEHAVSVASEF